MKFFKKTDLLIIVALLVLSAAVFAAYNYFATKNEIKAEIYLGAKLMKTVDLSLEKNTSFSIPGKENVAFHIYEDGSIAFERSDCPDQVCVQAGRLHIAGQSAACLPNGLILKIVPQKENGYHENDVVV